MVDLILHLYINNYYSHAFIIVIAISMGYSPAGKVKSSIFIHVLDVDINVGNFNK